MRAITKKHISIIGMVLFFVLMAVAYTYNLFSLDTIINHKEALRGFVARYYPYAVFFYIGLYALSVILLLPFISLVTMLGGFLFKPLWATVFVIVGASIGITILVTLLRFFFKNSVNVHNVLLQRFNTMLERHGIAYLLSVRFIVVIPFFIVNSLVAVTTIPLFTIVWTTGVGIIPVTLLFTFAGSHLEQIQNISDLFTPNIIIIFGCLALLALIPVIFEKLGIQLQ